MSEVFIFFSQVEQDGSNAGTAKLGQDIALTDDKKFRFPDGAMVSLSEIIEQNAEQINYGAQSAEVIQAKTSFAAVDDSYMSTANEQIFSEKLGPAMSFVTNSSGQVVPVHVFEGTEEEFLQVTKGFETIAALDTVLDVKGDNNISSGTIVLPNSLEHTFGKGEYTFGKGVTMDELIAAVDVPIADSYISQIAAAAEFEADPSWGVQAPSQAAKPNVLTP